jgi:hypothetical protein
MPAEEQRPEVVVTNPRDGGPAAEVLEAGDGSRRGLIAAVAVLVALAAFVSWSAPEGRDEPAPLVALEQARRSAGGVAVELDRERRTARVQVPFTLRNAGSEELTVVRAALGELVSDRAAVLGPGREVRLTLAQEVPCADVPAGAPIGGKVLVTVQIAGGGPTVVEVPTDLSPDPRAVAAVAGGDGQVAASG